MFDVGARIYKHTNQNERVSKKILIFKKKLQNHFLFTLLVKEN